VPVDLDLPVLIFRVADVACALPCAHVIETMRRPPITPLDDMPAFTAGMATIRGAAILVVDVAVLLGRQGAGERVITVRAGDRTVALLVDDVVGVGRVSATEMMQRPALLSESPHPVVHALAVKDHALHLVLDAGRLVQYADRLS
jgi:purine-binding chemotaxis protein CheW